MFKEKVLELATYLGYVPDTKSDGFKKNNEYLTIYVLEIVQRYPEDNVHEGYQFELSTERGSFKIGFYKKFEDIAEEFNKFQQANK